MIKVSIIVPIYQVETYLDKCVDSLINQTLENIEIILIDDGSPDNCPKICDYFASKDKRIQVIHKENEGVDSARNDGLKIAQGEYVIFCDPDDWMEINACELLYAKAKETDADIVIGDIFRVTDAGKEYVDFYNGDFVTDDRYFIDELIKTDIYRTYCPIPAPSGPAFGYGGPWNKLVRRKMIEENNILFDLSLKGIFDDILYSAYILSAANKIAYMKEAVYDYVVTDNSITHAYNPNTIEINNAIFKAWNEFFAIQKDGEKYIEPYYACVLRRLEESLRLYFLNENNDHDEQFLKEEFKNIINISPYKEAVHRANLSKVSKKQQFIAILSRMNMISLIFDVQVLRRRYA